MSGKRRIFTLQKLHEDGRAAEGYESLWRARSFVSLGQRKELLEGLDTFEILSPQIYLSKEKRMRALTAFSFCLFVLISAHARDAWPQAQDFTATYVAPGHDATLFLDLPFRTVALAFDSTDNLYVTDFANDRSQSLVNVLRYLEGTGYTVTETPYTYSTTMMGVNGFAFGKEGTLFVSEFEYPGDSGLIRKAAIPNDKVFFLDFRPTGIAITDDDTIYFPGRKFSDLNFGNLYKVESFSLPASIVMDGLVAYAIAINNSGQFYFGLEGNSVWTLDPYSNVPVKVATFTGGYVEELAFDSTESLYVLEGGSDVNNRPWSIIKMGLPKWTEIDIKPGSNPNCINDRNKGKVPIAILGKNIDVKRVDLTTILVDDENSSTPSVLPIRTNYKDVDKDGYLDIVMHFSTSELSLSGLIVDGNTLSISFEDDLSKKHIGSDVIYTSGGPNCF